MRDGSDNVAAASSLTNDASRNGNFEGLSDGQSLGVQDLGAVFRRPVPDKQGDGGEADHEQRAPVRIGLAPTVWATKNRCISDHRGADTDAGERNAERRTRLA